MEEHLDEIIEAFCNQIKIDSMQNSIEAKDINALAMLVEARANYGMSKRMHEFSKTFKRHRLE